MRTFLAPVALTCILLLETPCPAQTAQSRSESVNAQSGANDEARTGHICTFWETKNQIEDYPNCILQDSQGRLFVAQNYVAKMKFNSYGLAAVWDNDPSRHEFMYVDRKGRVIIQGVAIWDQWAEEFSDGLVAMVANGKYGFADRQGKIVIAPQYEYASPFKHGYAEVCIGCRKTCIVASDGWVDPDCEHWTMTGGEWLKINKAGRVVAKVQH